MAILFACGFVGGRPDSGGRSAAGNVVTDSETGVAPIAADVGEDVSAVPMIPVADSWIFRNRRVV